MKSIRIHVTHAKATALGIPHTSTGGVVAPFEINTSVLTPAARFVAEHITATYVLDEYTDKIPVTAVAGFTMAERDREKGKSEEYIEANTRCYGDYYAKDPITIPITFPAYGMGMQRPEEVIEETVRQCIASGTARFKSGDDVFTV